jgi:hypothetical protein
MRSFPHFSRLCPARISEGNSLPRSAGCGKAPAPAVRLLLSLFANMALDRFANNKYFA